MNSFAVKEKMRDLSSNQIHFERERDPVGEKTTKIGAAASGRRTHEGVRRASRAAPLCGFLFWWSSLRQGLFLSQN